MKIGIIGIGRLGALIARYLSQDFKIIAYDQNYSAPLAKKMGIEWGEFDEICEQKIIIPIVPISAFENVIREMAPKLKPGTLVIDVCSVKILPSEIMLRYLPQHTQILATHPMFGPDSAKDTLFGKKVALCPIRIESEILNNLKKYLANNSINVIETTPDKHDQEIAHSLVLTHFIGRALIDYDAKPLEIDTLGYRRLMKILKTVENDTWQLFIDMNKYNPYAAEVNQLLSNLIKNAIEAIPEDRKGLIKIESKYNIAGFVQLKIKDNGKGIDKNIQDGLFKEIRTSKEKGTGVGLYLCNTIIKNNKIDVDIDSTQNVGTTFILTFKEFIKACNNGLNNVEEKKFVSN